jgi:hypothetical protein
MNWVGANRIPLDHSADQSSPIFFDEVMGSKLTWTGAASGNSFRLH